jgi:ABC-type dipeptide/oligopeptide/nickel transport system permease component
MLAYIIRRIFVLVPTLLGVSILVFLMLHFTPGDPAELPRVSDAALYAGGSG